MIKINNFLQPLLTGLQQSSIHLNIPGLAIGGTN